MTTTEYRIELRALAKFAQRQQGQQYRWVELDPDEEVTDSTILARLWYETAVSAYGAERVRVVARQVTEWAPVSLVAE